MKTTICASRRGALFTLVLSTAWMFPAMDVLARPAIPFRLEAALNLSLLPAAALLVWGFLRLLRPKTVLRAGERTSGT